MSANDPLVYQVYRGSKNNPDHSPKNPPKQGTWVWWRTGEHPQGRWQAMEMNGSTPEGKIGLDAWRENQKEFPIWQDQAHGSPGDWGNYTCHACDYLGDGYPEPGHMTVCDGICKREQCPEHPPAGRLTDDEELVRTINAIAELHEPGKRPGLRDGVICVTCIATWPCRTAELIGDAYPWPDVED